MKLYTKTICPKCLWVKSELETANLPVEIINIDHDEDAKQAIVKAGFQTVPVLEIDGEWLVETNLILDKIAELSA